jgi:hypothetical protein
MTCFLDYLTGIWYGMVLYIVMAYWVLSIMFRSFKGCRSCAHLWSVHYYTTSAIIQLFREQMVIAVFVNYDEAPVGLKRRDQEVS